MTEYKIEKGVPIPPNAKAPGGLMGAVRNMQPGDSIFVPNKSSTDVSGTGRVVGQRMADGRKYTVRKMDGGTRIWRVQ